MSPPERDVTFIIPVAPYHMDMVERALESIDRQTVPAKAIVIMDRKGRGPGFARNRGLERVTTKYVSFLDADDELLPTFVEATLAAYRNAAFIYTDWLDGDTHTVAPSCPWKASTRNVITTLLRTEDARAVGGFDEALEALEDSDFYYKLFQRGLCGVHVPQALFRYGAAGRRSKAFFGTPQYHAAMRRFNEVYGRKVMAENCGGCGAGNNGTVGGDAYAYVMDEPLGEKQPGDVAALATWQGNRREMGRATGRLYPRAGWANKVWVDPRDIAALPGHWRRADQPVITPPVITPPVMAAPPTNSAPREVVILDPDRPEPEPLKTLEDIGAFIFGPAAQPPPKPVPPVGAKPNVKKVSRLYGAAQS